MHQQSLRKREFLIKELFEKEKAMYAKEMECAEAESSGAALMGESSDEPEIEKMGSECVEEESPSSTLV